MEFLHCQSARVVGTQRSLAFFPCLRPNSERQRAVFLVIRYDLLEYREYIKDVPLSFPSLLALIAARGIKKVGFTSRREGLKPLTWALTPAMVVDTSCDLLDLA